MEDQEWTKLTQRHKLAYYLARHTGSRHQSRRQSAAFLPVGTCLKLLQKSGKGCFDKLGEGVIQRAGKVAVHSSRRAPAAAPQTFPLQGWPGNCVSSLGAAKRSVLSTHVCSAVKSLPARYVKQLVRDADDREQLLQFAAQEADLNIHLQDLPAFAAEMPTADGQRVQAPFCVLACKVCEEVWLPSSGDNRSLLVSCSTCEASYHVSDACLGAPSPLNFKGRSSRQCSPAGCGALWLCPDCDDLLEQRKLRPTAIRPAFYRGGVGDELPTGEQVLQLQDYRDWHTNPHSRFADSSKCLSSSRKYLPVMLQRERQYRQRVQRQLVHCFSGPRQRLRAAEARVAQLFEGLPPLADQDPAAGPAAEATASTAEVATAAASNGAAAAAPAAAAVAAAVAAVTDGAAKAAPAAVLAPPTPAPHQRQQQHQHHHQQQQQPAAQVTGGVGGAAGGGGARRLPAWLLRAWARQTAADAAAAAAAAADDDNDDDSASEEEEATPSSSSQSASHTRDAAADAVAAAAARDSVSGGCAAGSSGGSVDGIAEDEVSSPSKRHCGTQQRPWQGVPMTPAAGVTAAAAAGGRRQSLLYPGRVASCNRR